MRRRRSSTSAASTKSILGRNRRLSSSSRKASTMPTFSSQKRRNGDRRLKDVSFNVNLMSSQAKIASAYYTVAYCNEANLEARQAYIK